MATIGHGKANPWRLAGWSLLAILLLAPLAAMQVTDAVAWDAADFALATLLLAGAGLLLELAIWKLPRTAHRLAVAAILALAVLLIWADAAVGVF